jgi:hypothetical protein
MTAPDSTMPQANHSPRASRRQPCVTALRSAPHASGQARTRHFHAAPWRQSRLSDRARTVYQDLVEHAGQDGRVDAERVQVWLAPWYHRSALAELVRAGLFRSVSAEEHWVVVGRSA